MSQHTVEHRLSSSPIGFALENAVLALAREDGVFYFFDFLLCDAGSDRPGVENLK